MRSLFQQNFYFKHMKESKKIFFLLFSEWQNVPIYITPNQNHIFLRKQLNMNFDIILNTKFLPNQSRKSVSMRSTFLKWKSENFLYLFKKRSISTYKMIWGRKKQKAPYDVIIFRNKTNRKNFFMFTNTPTQIDIKEILLCRKSRLMTK